MDLAKFQENIKFSQELGFNEVYLWGVEWWYAEHLAGRSEIWAAAKALFGPKL